MFNRDKFTAGSFADSIVKKATESLWPLDYHTSPEREKEPGFEENDLFRFNHYHKEQLQESLTDLISEAARLREQIRVAPEENK